MPAGSPILVSGSAAGVRRPLSIIAVGLAMAAALFWVWMLCCAFPAWQWNEVRLAPVFMAAHGVPVYSLTNQAALTTWLYGPMPLWIWAPALLADSASQAVLIVDALNAGLTLIALLLTCLYWPVPGLDLCRRLAGFALLVLFFPSRVFLFLTADNAAIALGLISNLLLVVPTARPGRSRQWMAALIVAAAIGSKQNAVGLLLGQIAWLAWDAGRKAALLHVGRTLAMGALLGAIAIWQFGWSQLWFGAVTLPGLLPWATWADVLNRVQRLGLETTVTLILPVLMAWLLRNELTHRGHYARLPFFTWAATLPLSLAGTLTIGGDANSLHSLQYVLPLLVLTFCRTASLDRPRAAIGLALTCFSLLCVRVLQSDSTSLRPNLHNLETAQAIDQHYRGTAWLPWNPLVTYFTRGRFYHAEDGLYIRVVTGLGVSEKDVRAHLPANLSAIAWKSGMSWGFPEIVAPLGAHEQGLGQWRIIEWSPP
jgi:hypothetical protein